MVCIDCGAEFDPAEKSRSRDAGTIVYRCTLCAADPRPIAPDAMSGMLNGVTYQHSPSDPAWVAYDAKLAAWTARKDAR